VLKEAKSSVEIEKVNKTIQERGEKRSKKIEKPV
jgi:hypothetical protein